MTPKLQPNDRLLYRGEIYLVTSSVLMGGSVLGPEYAWVKVRGISDGALRSLCGFSVDAILAEQCAWQRAPGDSHWCPMWPEES